MMNDNRLKSYRCYDDSKIIIIKVNVNLLKCHNICKFRLNYKFNTIQKLHKL